MKSTTPTISIIGFALVAGALGSVACTTDSQGTGLQTNANVGGSAVGNGGASPGNGGANAAFGGDAASQGGSSSTGNATSTGGATTGTGGATATGGAGTNVGGNSSTGGASSTSTGGKAATGGTATSTGGKAATGGTTTSTGGKAATGGTATSTGGKAATGGAATSVGGSTGTAANFSFFVISYKAIQAKSGSAQGFGGDLRYGTEDGLTGADKICTEVAETSSPGNGKTWKAYLSTSTVNAIDRIGEGPWYDRLGRLVTTNKDGLLSARPIGANSAIANDLPNEDGVPNHAPDGKEVDNHDTLTGTNHLGTVYGASAHCTNWTSSTASTTAKPRVGHTWPRGTATGNTPGMAHWASALDESGCGKGVNIVETGGPGNDGIVGSGGGYGGWYCFATTP